MKSKNLSRKYIVKKKMSIRLRQKSKYKVLDLKVEIYYQIFYNDFFNSLSKIYDISLQHYHKVKKFLTKRFLSINFALNILIFML